MPNNQMLSELNALSNQGDTENGNLLVTGAVASPSLIKGAIVVSPAVGVVGSVLPAVAMVGGVILRSGPTAAYGDTTDSAANIIAVLPNAVVGEGFDLRIVNSVPFVNTVAAGAGVTLGGVTAIAASTWRDFVGVITNVATPAVTLTGTGSGTL